MGVALLRALAAIVPHTRSARLPQENAYIEDLRLGAEEYQTLSGRLVQALQTAPDPDRFKDVAEKAKDVNAYWVELGQLSPKDFVREGPFALAAYDSVTKQVGGGIVGSGLSGAWMGEAVGGWGVGGGWWVGGGRRAHYRQIQCGFPAPLLQADDLGVKANQDAKEAAADASLESKAAAEKARVDKSKASMLEAVRKFIGVEMTSSAAMAKVETELKERNLGIDAIPAYIETTLSDIMNLSEMKSEMRTSWVDSVDENSQSIIRDISEFLSLEGVSFHQSAVEISSISPIWGEDFMVR